MIRPRLVTLGGLFALAIVLAWSAAAAAQPAPLVVEADQVAYDEATQLVEATGNVRLRYRGIRLAADRAVFDLQREHLTAEGRVVLIDTLGREFRGERLTYDVRLQLAEMLRAETIVDRIYIRGERVQAVPDKITAAETVATPCDPGRPAVRVTAQQVEVHPGDRLIARRASLWVGRYRVLTLPVLVVSLRSTEETARSFPRIGYNNVDGFWIEYVYGYDLKTIPAAFYTKYGTRSGFIVRNTLTYRRPPFVMELTVGRNQDVDLQVFDQAEAVLVVSEQQVGSLPLLASGSIRVGWFAEPTTGVHTSRAQYTLGLRTPPLALSPQTTVQAGVSWSDAAYGTGDRQAVWRADLALTHQLSAREALRMWYNLVDVYGVTPFTFDTIVAEDRIHRLILAYTRTGIRGAAATGFSTGFLYNFRDSTISAVLGYGERVPTRYHWGVSAEYNWASTNLRLTVDAGHTLGRGTYGTISAIYNTLNRAYEDLDLAVTARLCDCLDVTLKYRHVRQEIWFEVGLSAFPATRLQFQFARP